MFNIEGSRRHRSGFSLVELVIVIVIMGIIAAIAIPRLSRGARSAGSSALKANLAALRNSIELYAAEHDGKYPDTDVVAQLIEFSNVTGTVTGPKDVSTGVVYGAYLKDIPALPVGTKKGATGIYVETGAPAAPPGGAATDGWWYKPATQELRANLPNSDKDDDGKQYNTY